MTMGVIIFRLCGQCCLMNGEFCCCEFCYLMSVEEGVFVNCMCYLVRGGRGCTIHFVIHREECGFACHVNFSVDV